MAIKIPRLFTRIPVKYRPLTRAMLRHRVQSMRKVEHIEGQIRELSSAEFAELREWVLAQDWASWDSQIERDARSGKLEKLVSDAKAEYESGKPRKL